MIMKLSIPYGPMIRPPWLSRLHGPIMGKSCSMKLEGTINVESGEYIPNNPTISIYQNLLFFIGFELLDDYLFPTGVFIDSVEETHGLPWDDSDYGILN